jgi:hypothetical protein
MKNKEKQSPILYYIIAFLCILVVINVFVKKMNMDNTQSGIGADMTNAETSDSGNNMYENAFELLISQCGLKDFDANGNVLTAKTNDPWIDYHFSEAMNIKKIIIDINEMSIGTSKADIFYDEQDYITGNSYINTTLSAGENVIPLDNANNIKTIRIDLTDQNGVVINVKHIYLLSN